MKFQDQISGLYSNQDHLSGIGAFEIFILKKLFCHFQRSLQILTFFQRFLKFSTFFSLF